MSHYPDLDEPCGHFADGPILLKKAFVASMPIF